MRLLACREPGIAIGTLKQFATSGELGERFLVSGNAVVLRFVGGEWQFPGGAGQMILQDIAIAGIGDGVLALATKELLWVLHEVLVEGILAGQQDHKRLATLAPDSAGSLPGIDDGSWVTDENADIESANVDPQLQC